MSQTKIKLEDVKVGDVITHPGFLSIKSLRVASIKPGPFKSHLKFGFATGESFHDARSEEVIKETEVETA
jgi:hypothetical protein